MRICIFVVAVFTALGEAASASSIDQCPPHLPRNSHLKSFQYDCYTFHLQERVSFDAAQLRCSQSGGNLASIDHKDTNTFLKDTLNDQYSNNGVNNKAWIGMRWNNSRGTFQWTDGSLKSYLHFEFALYYKRLGKDCLGLSAYRSSWQNKWQNLLCSSRHGFICRYPKYPLDKCPSHLKRDKYLKAFGNKCYVFETKKRSFRDADYYCYGQGGELAMPKTEDMFDFILHHLKTTYFDDYSKTRFMLGGEFHRRLKGLYWLDGTPFDRQLPDYKTNPYAHSDDCAAITSEFDTFQTLRYCSGYGNKYHFICQFKLEKDETKVTTNSAPYVVMTSSPLVDATTTTTTTTTKQPSKHKSCGVIACNNDCGLYGFKTDPLTHCISCECDTEK